IRSFCVVAFPGFVDPSANRLIVAKRGENGKGRRQRVLSREQVQHPCCARRDYVLPRRAVDRRARVDQDLGGNRPVVDALALWIRAVERVGGGGVEQRLAALAAPRDQRWVFSQQRSQPLVVLVVNRDLGLRGSPLERAAQAFLHLLRQIRPAGKSVFARDHEL